MSGATQAESGAAVLAGVQALHDRGLYRQALAAGEQQWGPVRQWQDPAARLLAARLVYQLGLYRMASALALSTWRRHRDLPQAQYAGVRALLNQRGPFAASQAWERIGETLAADPRLQADWLGLRGILFALYRDWDRARAMLERAVATGGDSTEFDYERSWLLQQQDRYDEALAHIEPLAQRPGRLQRVAMQRTANLYEITGRTDDAIALLQDGMSRFESVDLGMQLHGLLADRERHAEADACLARVQALLPGGEPWIGESIRAARFQSLYQQGEHAAAIAALDGARGRYFRKVRENLVAAPADATQRVLDVPFIRQHHMTCAPATFAAISRFHGQPVDHLEVAAEICYDGTPALEERRWVAARGWAVREFELNLDDVRTLVDAGCPVGFVTVEPGSAHMQAIIGYDTRRGIYLLRDPFLPRVQEILIDGAHEAYAASGPRCMVFVPAARAGWLASLPLRHATLYDHYFDLQSALDANDRDRAVAALARLEDAAPGHRLALWGRRSIASYDNDHAANLAAVDQLLVKFPEDLNLLVARARLLGELGKHRERLAFLEECRARGIDHPYLWQELADQLAQDYRRTRDTQKLVAAILRRQPTSASALWTLAGVHWDTGERAQAFEYYRLCICLEDKTEGYADSYFRAARYLRQTDDALAYLRRRAEQLGGRSPNASITLSRALDVLGRGQEARAALEDALQKHPRDAWLVAEAVDMMLGTGDAARATQLLDAHGDVLHPVLRLLKEAAVADFLGDAERQLELYARVLAIQPLHQGAIVNTAGILARRESPEAAIAFLDRYLAGNPFNHWLMREKLSHVVDLPYAQQEAHLQAMAARHPDDTRLLAARAALAREQGRLDEALQLVDAAIRIDPDEAWLYRRRGELLLAADRVDEARAAYREAIRLSVDADGLFEALLSTYPTFEGKREALAYIHGQLMQQVSFGNGILEFQQLARRYLEDANVAQFLEAAVAVRPDLWQSWTGLTRFRLELNEPDAALAAAEGGVARFPLVPRVWIERAAVHRVRGDAQAAIADLRQALAINPRFLEASTQLIDLLESVGDLEAAMAELDRAQRLAPRHPPLHAYRAEMLWRAGDRTAALEILANALRTWPFYGWAWSTLVGWCEALGAEDRARALGRELAEAHPGAGVLWQRLSEVLEGDEDKAQALDRALACEPRNVDFLLARCGLLVEDGQVVEARGLIDRSFAGSDKPSEVRGYEAWLLARTGRRADAIAAMEQVVADDPGFYRGWSRLAQWYAEEKRRDDVLRAARMLVRLYPQSPTALVAAAEFFLEHGADDKALVAEAREYLERALRQQHSNTYTFLTLVDLYFDDGNTAAIRALFDRHTVDEQDIYVRARYVRLLLAEGRVPNALDAWEAFLRDVPDNDWMLFTPWRWFIDAGHGEAVRHRVLPLAAREDTPLPVARLWMQAMIEEAGARPGALAAAMRAARATARPDLWLAAVAWLLPQRGDRAAAANDLLYAFGNELAREPAVWPALVYGAVAGDNWNEVRRLARHAFAEAPARALYFCSVGWRFVRDATRAQELTALAESRPEDDSRDNLRFWRVVDDWCNGVADVDAEVLASLDLRELTGVERLLYDLLQALPPAPLDAAAMDIPAFGRAVDTVLREHPLLNGQAMVRHVAARMRRELDRRDHTPGWAGVRRRIARWWVFARALAPRRKA